MEPTSSSRRPPGADWGTGRRGLLRGGWAQALKASAAVAGLLFLSLSFAPDAQARMGCSYAGAPTNRLTVTADRGAFGEIYRRGSEIMVGESLEHPRLCSGGEPTVLNTDTIKVVTRGGFSFVELDLGGGAFGPGATPEADGASEVEIVFSGRGAFASVRGTSRADEFHWGPGGVQAGLNLNPRNSGDQDVDVTVRGRFSFLVAVGAAGDDTIIPAPGGVGPNEAGVFSDGGTGNDLLIAPPSGGGTLEGGPGKDRLIGGSDFLGDNLDGGSGNDRVVGGAGPDVIKGGRGRDLLSGGRGRDRINSRDSTRDRVRCGPGRDRVKADRRDRLGGCEAIRRR